MSVKRGKGGSDPALKATVERLEKEAEQSAGRQEATTALLSLSFRAQVKADRKAGTGIISDAEILQSAELVEYPQYSAEAVAYEKGEILANGEGLYFEVVADHTSNAAYPLETTFAYYRFIELAHEGTLEDPIPYPEAAGVLVAVKSGLYYAYKGGVYLAKADMPNCSYAPNTAGMWQWEAVS